MFKSPAYNKAFLQKFLAAQGVIIPIVLGMFFSDEAVQYFADQQWLAVAGLATTEIIVFLFILWIQESVEDEQDFLTDPEKKKTVMRFCTRDDTESTESVYEEWFSQSLSIDDQEYGKIVDRGQFVRVAEVTKKHSYGESIFVAGYYAVFPISQATLDKLYAGKLKEKDLKSTDILDIDNRSASILYICEAVSSKKCSVRHELMGDLYSYCAYLISTNANIRKIATWPYTKYGIKSVKKRKFRPIKAGFFGSNFYEMPVDKVALKGVRKFKSVHTVSYS